MSQVVSTMMKISMLVDVWFVKILMNIHKTELLVLPPTILQVQNLPFVVLLISTTPDVSSASTELKEVLTLTSTTMDYVKLKPQLPTAINTVPMEDAHVAMLPPPTTILRPILALHSLQPSLK